MTTREALARMADAGAFESLATASLRYLEDDCRTVIHHGTNSLGKPIKSLVDAWCLVPGSAPPRFVMLQHTTVAQPSLKSKWLGEGGGDLQKAGEQAARLRVDFPVATFRIFLCTNRIPSNELQAAIYQIAEGLRLEAVIIDQSRLSDFLDSPEGQCLRRNFLGVAVDSLSEDVLAELSLESVDLHAQEFLSGGVVSRVQRETDKELSAAVSDLSITLLCLLADPGFGKSTTAQFVLREHIKNGGFGLWLSAATLAAAISLSDAVVRTLCFLCPGLSPESASSWDVFCGKQRLLLVIDDINRDPNSIRLLQRLQGWIGGAKSDSSDQSRYQPVVAICPVWTHVWEASRDPTKIHNSVRTISFGSLEASEATEAVEKLITSHGLTVSRKEAEECAANLSNDPYLIGIFGALLSASTTHAELRQLTENVIRRYVDQMLRTASLRSNETFTTTDLQDALQAMATQMLLKKDLRPPWSKMRLWLKELPSPIRPAAEFLRSDARICRLAEGDVLTFRHDRLMQFLAAECLPPLLSVETVLNEVYYAELIGRVLARGGVDESRLHAIASSNPLAIFEALRVIGNPKTGFQSKIADASVVWAREFGTHASTPVALRSAVGLPLMETDSCAVLQITPYLAPDFRVLAAAFRNGSALAGASFLGEIGRHVGLEPNTRNTWRDNVIFHAFRNHREHLTIQLRGILVRQDLTFDQTCGAILLAGYLAAPELSHEVVRCVENSGGNWRLLPEAIWAVGRAGNADVQALLDKLFLMLRSVPDDKDQHGWSPKHAIARAFRDLSPRTFPVEIVTYIIQRADEGSEIQEMLFPLIHAMDLPISLEHFARYKAARARAQGKMEVSSIDFIFCRWDPRNDMVFVRPSNASRDRLRVLWQSQSEDPVVRSAAFAIWSWTAETSDILHLRSVSKDSPQFRTALWKRAQLADESCVPDLCKCLADDPWFAHIAHHVWCADLFAIVDSWLERFRTGEIDQRGNAASCFEHLLPLIPPLDAEKLLTKNWIGLRTERYFVQAALLVSTAASMKLADEAIRAHAINEPFEFLEMRMNDVRQMNPRWSAGRFLRHLEPYLDLLSQKELSQYPQYCKWAGETTWCRQHILPRLPSEQQRLYVADESSIRNELERLANDEHGWRFPEFVFERLVESEAQPKQIIEAAVTGFDSAPSIKRYSILAEAVVQLGDRADLSLLNRRLEQGWKEAADAIRIDAEFRLRRRTLAGEFAL